MIKNVFLESLLYTIFCSISLGILVTILELILGESSHVDEKYDLLIAYSFLGIASILTSLMMAKINQHYLSYWVTFFEYLLIGIANFSIIAILLQTESTKAILTFAVLGIGSAVFSFFYATHPIIWFFGLIIAAIVTAIIVLVLLYVVLFIINIVVFFITKPLIKSLFSIAGFQRNN